MRQARVIYVDFSGRPTGSCIAAVIPNGNGRLCAVIQTLPVMGSSQGEFLAIILGLQLAKKRRWRRVVIRCDNVEATSTARMDSVSEASPFFSYHPVLQALKCQFTRVTFENIYGTQNVSHSLSQSGHSALQMAAANDALRAMLDMKPR